MKLSLSLRIAFMLMTLSELKNWSSGEDSNISLNGSSSSLAASPSARRAHFFLHLEKKKKNIEDVKKSKATDKLGPVNMGLMVTWYVVGYVRYNHICMHIRTYIRYFFLPFCLKWDILRGVIVSFLASSSSSAPQRRNHEFAPAFPVVGARTAVLNVHSTG